MRDGSDYLKSLKARRCAIYIGGERVNDATSHPAFANAAATAANLYDTTADPANAGRLTHQIPGDATRYNNIWLLPRNRQDIDARNRVHEVWSESTWGLFGRSPDHVAGWVSGMACCPQMLDVHGDGFAANVTKYFEYARENDLFTTYAIVPPAGVEKRGFRRDHEADILAHVQLGRLGRPAGGRRTRQRHRGVGIQGACDGRRSGR